MTDGFNPVNKKTYNHTALHQKIRELSENPTQFSILMIVAQATFKCELYGTIAQEVKVSEKTIAKEIRRLKELGLLTGIKTSSHFYPYHFNLSNIFL